MKLHWKGQMFKTSILDLKEKIMKKSIYIFMIAVIQLSFMSCSDSQVPEESSKMEEVNYSEAFLLDVRTPQEYKSGSVDGSVNIPLSELKENIDQIPEDKFILVDPNKVNNLLQEKCTDHYRGLWGLTSAIELLKEEGFTNLENGVNSSNVRKLLDKE